MTINYHIDKLKQYEPTRTEAGESAAALAKNDARVILAKFEELAGKVCDTDNKERIVSKISEGINATNDLIASLSECNHSRERIRSLVDDIEIKLEHASDWVFNQHK
jgi:hypothetical protein